MKYILIIEIPSKILADKRIIITRELNRLAYEKPKRNVFLLEVEKESEIKKIKEWVIDYTDPSTKVNYYQLVK